MVKSQLKLEFSNDDTGWDMGLADLIEETPMTTENRKTRFELTEDKDGSNVFLLRPQPSWKQHI